MKSNFIYAPILKWKKGEQEALKELDKSIKDKIIPLIEIPPEINLSKFEGTLKNWENDYFYFDVLPETYEEHGGEIYFELLEKCNQDYVIPVILLSDTEDAIREAIDYSNHGIAIRITSDDFEFLETNLLNIKKYIEYESVDLIIDFKEVKDSNVGEKKIIMKALLPDIPKLSSFRNIIISSCSFPQSLSNIEKYEPIHLDRYEFQLWKSFSTLEDKYNIEFIYSDYCINHPSYFEYIPGMSPAFNIRYTTDKSYVIVKGDSMKKGGLDPGSIKPLCEKLINSGFYSGTDFSFGDEYIGTRCNEESKNFGNLTTWRKVGTNHHITLVVNQISNLL